MPERPKVRCKKEGCPALVSPLKRYCEAHQRETWRDQNKNRYINPFYKTSPWIKIRSAYLARNPMCKSCGGQAVVCDHIKAIRLGGDRFDWKNLQGLCRQCDAVKRGRESYLHKLKREERS